MEKSQKVLLLFITCFIGTVYSHNILLMAPFPGLSHWLFLDNFVRELLDRGHNVTAITNFKTKAPHENYTEVMIDPPFDFAPYFPFEDLFDSRYEGSDTENLKMYWKAGLLTSKHALDDKNVQRLIEDQDSHFDLVISEQFAQESFLMFAHKFKCPFVTLGTLGWSDYMDRNFGLTTPWSFVPHPIPLFSSEMTFYDRCYNVIFSIIDKIVRYYYYLPAQDNLAKEYFGKVIEGDLPYVGDLERQVSVMLINHHRSLPPIRPLMPGQINIAGAHIKPPKPLPEDLKEFLDNSENGVVVMSLGTHVQSSYMPKEKLQMFLNVFKNLTTSVLWKYEDSDIELIPENVKIQKWLPQSDVLAHKNVKLFITHGGMFGSQEGLSRGVPMLFIPFYGDQPKNALKVSQLGYGEVLPFSEITQESLSTNVRKMLENEKYKINAEKYSKIFLDNPVHPMEEAMFWIEYVISHNGASFLKSYGVKQHWYQHYLLDVFGFFLSMLILGVVGIIFSVKIIKHHHKIKNYFDSKKVD